jgi:hypothetical protein
MGEVQNVPQVVHVHWNDAPIAGFINLYRGRVGRMMVEYTLEIVPNSEAPIKSKMYMEGGRHQCYKSPHSARL